MHTNRQIIDAELTNQSARCALVTLYGGALLFLYIVLHHRHPKKPSRPPTPCAKCEKLKKDKKKLQQKLKTMESKVEELSQKIIANQSEWAKTLLCSSDVTRVSELGRRVLERS